MDLAWALTCEPDEVGRYAAYCRDCGIDTFAIDQYPYSVPDEVWEGIGLGPDDGMLCLDCLCERLAANGLTADVEVGAHLVVTEFGKS